MIIQSILTVLITLTTYSQGYTDSNNSTESPTILNTNIVNNDLKDISKESPYKEIYKHKKWNLNKVPKGNSWEFITEKNDSIKISYTGSPYGGSTLTINDLKITDNSNCKEYSTPDPSISEDEPLFARAECLSWYHGFNFNNKNVEYNFEDSMDGIWISKNEPKIAIYGGKMIINFEKKDYKINKDFLDLEKEGYILLRAVY